MILGHLLLDLNAIKTPNMETFFDFLENLVSRINMDPISRATVLKSSPINPTYLSAIIVIAQSQAHGDHRKDAHKHDGHDHGVKHLTAIVFHKLLSQAQSPLSKWVECHLKQAYHQEHRHK